MDHIDFQILTELQADGRLPMAELAQRVGLSGPAVADRVRKLERQGMIKGYAAQIAPAAVGLSLIAFIDVDIDHPRNNALCIERIQGLPEVCECHHVTGEHMYLLKVVCRDTAHLDHLITHGLKSIDAIVRTRSTIVLSTAKDVPGIPLEVARRDA